MSKKLNFYDIFSSKRYCICLFASFKSLFLLISNRPSSRFGHSSICQNNFIILHPFFIVLLIALSSPGRFFFFLCFSQIIFFTFTSNIRCRSQKKIACIAEYVFTAVKVLNFFIGVLQRYSFSR